jgi:tripartite ATP-independent transporter DctP family solute receptor
MKTKHFIGMSTLIIFLLISTLSNVEAEKPIVIKLGHVGFADVLGDDHAMALVFKETLEKMSGGNFQVKIFPAGQLGKARDLVESVQRGTLKAAITPPGPMTMFLPEIDVMAVPFAFSDPLVFYKFTEGPWASDLKEKIRNKTGMRVIGISENGGFRNLLNSKRQIRSPEDMKGLKFRTINSKAYMEIIGSMGATATPIPWLELYTACQTGVVDGQQMMVEGTLTGKMYEVQKHITLTGHIVDYTYFLVNEKWFKGLSSDNKNYIIRAGQLAERAGQIASRLMDATGISKLKEKGMEVYIPTPDERQTFKKVTQDHMVKWLKAKFGDAEIDAFLKAVADAEKAVTFE